MEINFKTCTLDELAVFGDYLQQKGDERGEFIARALAGKPASFGEMRYRYLRWIRDHGYDVLNYHPRNIDFKFGFVTGLLCAPVLPQIRYDAVIDYVMSHGDQNHFKDVYFSAPYPYLFAPRATMIGKDYFTCSDGISARHHLAVEAEETGFPFLKQVKVTPERVECLLSDMEHIAHKARLALRRLSSFSTISHAQQMDMLCNGFRTPELNYTEVHELFNREYPHLQQLEK